MTVRVADQRTIERGQRCLPIGVDMRRKGAEGLAVEILKISIAAQESTRTGGKQLQTNGHIAHFAVGGQAKCGPRTNDIDGLGRQNAIDDLTLEMPHVTFAPAVIDHLRAAGKDIAAVGFFAKEST